jgi:DNA-binding transcriptional MerR regulator
LEYSIKDLEKLSGVQAHTIRIWEQRYGLLLPNRTDTNIRSYSDYYARKLLNVTTLIQNGWKISKVSKLSHEEINNEIQKLIESLDAGEGIDTVIVNQIVESGMLLSEASFEKAFSSALVKYGIRGSYLKVIYPTLVKIGLMWSKDEVVPVQEHFITNLIKQKLFTAIDALPYLDVKKESWLLFLPEGEHHELGLLMANYVLKEKGHKVIYLGANVPLVDVKKVVSEGGFDNLLMFAVARQTVALLTGLVSELGCTTSDCELWVAGAFDDDLIGELKGRINFVQDFDKFINQN